MRPAKSTWRALAVLGTFGAMAGCATLLGIDGDYGDADGGPDLNAGPSASTTSATSTGAGGAGEGGSSGAGGTTADSAATSSVAAGGAGGGGGGSNGGGSGGVHADGSAGSTGAGGLDAGRAGSAGAAGGGGSGGAGMGGAAGAGGGMGGKAGAGGGSDAGRVSPVNRVQRGSTTLAAGTATQKVTVQQLDPSRSFLVFGARFESAAPADIEITGQITAPNELTFARTGTTGSPAVPIYYYVAEFQSGVTVQRGASTLSATTATATLANVDLKKSFPLVTYRNTGANIGHDDFVRAKLTSATQLSLVNDLAAPSGVAEWQVVTFDGATVQSGDVTVGAADTTITAPLQAVEPTKTWLLFSYHLTTFSSGAAQEMIRGKVDAATQLAFRRGGVGAGGTLTWYAVSFNNGTAVQSATTTFGDTATTATATLASADVTRTIASAGGLYGRGGSTAIVTSESPGQSTFTFELTSASQLSLVRAGAAAGSAPSVDWFAVTFY